MSQKPFRKKTGDIIDELIKIEEGKQTTSIMTTTGTQPTMRQ